jgi:hypothetical protein
MLTTKDEYMLQDPNVERYIEQAMKPVLKQIKELKDEVKLLKAALHKTDVIRSCPMCGHIKCLCRTPLGNFV